MQALVLEKIHSPLVLKEVPTPEPEDHELLIQVFACGICRTDLHIIDAELPPPKLPIILGHQIVGTVKKLGKKTTRFQIGERVGVPWLGRTCHDCFYCKTAQENLCDKALFTGYNLNGGFAEYCTADEQFAFRLPNQYADLDVAPLLCGGLIGYRSFRMTGDAKRIGFYGFGSSAHLLIQLALYLNREIYVFTRPHDHERQTFAKNRGAVWTGGSDEFPEVLLDAAIIFAPDGALIPQALKSVRKGGVVISAEIHMSDIPTFPYQLLWGERSVRSVANLTRKDAYEFLEIAPKIPIKIETMPYPFERANEALFDLKEGRIKGSAVLFPKNTNPSFS